MFVTLKFAIIVVAIELLIGIGLALMLEGKIPGMSVLRTIFVLPMMIAPVCVGLIWRYMFDANAGPINTWLAATGWKPAWLADDALAFFAVCITDVWQFTPFVFIMALAGLQGLDSSLVEAARIDGARLWQVIWYIKLPLLMPILMITLLMRLIDALARPRSRLCHDQWRPGPVHRAVLAAHLQKRVRHPAHGTLGSAICLPAGGHDGVERGAPVSQQSAAAGERLMSVAEQHHLRSRWRRWSRRATGASPGCSPSVVIVPLAVMLATSFKTQRQIFDSGFSFFFTPTLENYRGISGGPLPRLCRQQHHRRRRRDADRRW